MKIEDRAIDQISPYEQNPRINAEAVEAVANSIREFGFRSPILIDSEGVIICGHTRLKAAIFLGLKTVPTLIADDLTPTQIKAYRIADNKTGEIAQWDERLLTIELAGLNLAEFDLEILGFGEDDLLCAMAGAPDFQPVGIETQSKLDEKVPTVCPECGHKWTE